MSRASKSIAKTCDMDLRLAVTAALLAAGTQRDAIRHELTLDSSSSDGRADMVIATDRALIGIEIKSGRDTLDRLESQRERYAARFDRLVLVADVRHAPSDYAAGQAMEFGVTRLFAEGRLIGREDDRARWLSTWGDAPWEPVREPRRHGAGDRQSPHAMLSLLWADEVASLAASLVAAGFAPACSGANGARYRYIPHFAEHVSIAQLRPRIAQTIRARPLNRWEVAFWRRYDADISGGAVK